MNARRFAMRALWAALLALIVAATARAGNEIVAGAPGQERIKDLATFAGVRDNQLVGYGLVVGLDGTGDRTTQTPFTLQSMRNMLGQLGVTLPADVNPQLKNVAAVMVTAELSPFAKAGQRFDVTVSSMGNANSLRGGTLLLTPLKGADGQIYAMAQGNLIVGGMAAQGADGSRVSVNIPSVGRITNGATVEREVPSPFAHTDTLVLNLNRADFTTATRLTEVINDRFGAGTARAIDGSSVRVQAPGDSDARVAFVAALENLPVQPGIAPARIVVNARTGTIVIGANVRLLPAAVAHGNVTVTISEQWGVSQPRPFSGGQTTAVPNSNVDVAQETGRMFLFDPGTSLEELVRAVNSVGVAPGDLVAILQALREVGALRADLVVI